MGAQASKPEQMASSSSSSSSTRHGNKSSINSSSVQFSPSFIDHLQNSPETDSTRAKALEVEIQNRVNAELRRLQAVASKEYADLQAQLSLDDAEKESELNNQFMSSSSSSSRLLPQHTGTGAGTGGSSQESMSPGDRLRQLGKEAVQGDIQQLQRKIEQSKQVRQLDQQVVKAKSDVIACLTEHDRRPLDCWAQVEKFKEEVAKLEDGWIQKVVS